MPISQLWKKIEKIILDLDPDPDQSQNLTECSISEKVYVSQKFYEHSLTTFWVILFNV